MNRAKTLLLLFLFYSSISISFCLQSNSSEDCSTTINIPNPDDPFNMRQWLPISMFEVDTVGGSFSTDQASVLNLLEEIENNSVIINKNLDLSVSQTLSTKFPVGAFPDLSSSESAKNSLQLDLSNCSVTLWDGAENETYSEFEKTYSYEIFNRTKNFSDDEDFSYLFSTKAGSGDYFSLFTSRDILYDPDNTTFLMNLWNSSSYPINPHSTPTILSFDYNLISEENLRTAPIHTLELQFSFREPDRPPGKSGVISIALLNHLLDATPYDDAEERVTVYSGIDLYNCSYSEIYFNRSAVEAGSGWHHFESNITHFIHGFLNDTPDIESHYSFLDSVEISATSSVGYFNFTLLLDNFQLVYWPSPRALPLSILWNETETPLIDGEVSLQDFGQIHSLMLNSAPPDLVTRLNGSVSIYLERFRNITIASTISFSNSSFGYLEADLNLPSLVASSETYEVLSVLPTEWINLTIAIGELCTSPTIEESIPNPDFPYSIGQLKWILYSSQGTLSGYIPNYIANLNLPSELQPNEWFFVNGTLLGPSTIPVKANVTFGVTCFCLEALSALDGSFSLFIPPIDLGNHTEFVLRVFWADKFQIGLWQSLLIPVRETDPLSIVTLVVPERADCGEMVEISGSLVSLFELEGFIIYETDNSSISVPIQLIRKGENDFEFIVHIPAPPWNITYHSRLVLRDILGNEIQSEVYKIYSEDNRPPTVILQYSLGSDGLNVTIFSCDDQFGSGIENVTLFVESYVSNWTFSTNEETEQGIYSYLIPDLSFLDLNVTVQVKDLAGNSIIVKDTIRLPSTKVNFADSILISIDSALIGSAFLIAVLSGSRIVQLARKRKVNL